MRRFHVGMLFTLCAFIACSGEETQGPPATSATSSSTGASSSAASTGGSSQGGSAGSTASVGGASGDPFACGTELLCQGGQEYCEIFLPGQPDGDPSYACQPLPSGCQPRPSCNCLPPMAPCTCANGPGGAVTITCAAP